MSNVTTTSDALAAVPHMRVLVCRTCHTFDEIPDWRDGPDSDPYLGAVTRKHGEAHHGQLFRLPIGFWTNEPYRQHLIDQMQGGVGKGLSVVDPKVYETHNTFMEDAMKCFQLHLRPKGACPDYMSDRKVLHPDTKEERRDAGIALRPVGPKVTLCQFCPVQSFYSSKENQ